MSVELRGAMHPGYEEVLTPDALDFVEQMQKRFGRARVEELARRPEGRRRLGFDPDTRELRESEWRIAPVPRPLEQRWVEITGPTDAKLVINALSSGADGFMADFEDASSPTWSNVVEGQANLRDAIDGTLQHVGDDGREYRLGDDRAVLHVRPRGWHLEDRHVVIDGDPVAGSFLDAGLFLFHNARRLLARGAGPYLYLPKLESYREARLWARVLAWAEDTLGLERGTCRVTVLVETLPAAFQMDEILWELRGHAAGLNAGRWDYIFSAIKCRPEAVLPDRSAVTMTAPFMRAYTELLVRTAHRRGAHAMGGMAALIPSRTDPDANERALAGVRADKEREARAGYDGTWVAHPDLVGVAREVLERELDGRPHQLDRSREDVNVTADDLLALDETPGDITEAGLRNDVAVAFRYISFWLAGRGAAAIDGLMEDAATAEIARAQLWQWMRHRERLADGRSVTPELVHEVLDEETAHIRREVGEQTWRAGRPDETHAVFDRVVFSDELEDFLTLVAYPYLP